MTTNKMLEIIESLRGKSRNVHGEPSPDDLLWSEKEIETAKRIARVLDDKDGWHVAPCNGGGISFECESLMIDVVET